MARRPSKNFFFAKLLKFDATTQKYAFNTTEDKFDDTIKREATTGGGLDSDKTLALLSGASLPPGWRFAKTGSNALQIRYNDTPVLSIADSGQVITISDLTAFGTM